MASKEFNRLKVSYLQIPRLPECGFRARGSTIRLALGYLRISLVVVATGVLAIMIFLKAVKLIWRMAI